MCDQPRRHDARADNDCNEQDKEYSRGTNGHETRPVAHRSVLEVREVNVDHTCGEVDPG